MVRQVKLFILLLPFIALFFAPSVLAETKTLNVTKDTYANKAYPDKANGSIGSVIVSNNLTDRLGYLQFENPDLPEGAIIDWGVLKFFVHELHYAPTAKLNLGPITGDWEENTLSWNNKPTINQTQAIEAQIALDAPGWREITITYLVRQWDEGTTENKGIFLYPLGFLYGTAETNFAFSFKSKESGAEKPKLEIEYHLPSDPTPTQTVTPAPETTLAPEAQTTISPTPQVQELTPTPEATAEATKSGGLSLNLSTGQVIIAGTILLSLLAALIAFVTYFGRQSQQKEKKSEEKKPSEEEKKKEEEE